MFPLSIPDLYIYPRTSPIVAAERTKKRMRNEKNNIGIEYFDQLHEYHEKWLISPESIDKERIICKTSNGSSY